MSKHNILDKITELHYSLCDYGISMPHTIEITLRSKKDLEVISDLMRVEIDAISDKAATIKSALPKDMIVGECDYQISELTTIFKYDEDE